jgi:NADH dehydrogenase
MRDVAGRRQRVVVIGAGFGGLNLAKGLRRVDVDVTIIDANNFHTVQPLLYVRGVFRRQRNVSVRMATVTGIDLQRRRVVTDVGAPLDYDTLVIAAGAVSTSFGVPGVEEHTFPLKELSDALRLREHLLERFEDAANAAAPLPDGALDVVVCGGGPTGVEVAGALRELYEHVFARDFPTLPVAAARIVIVEAVDRLLGTFTPKSGSRAEHTLARRGVEVITGVGVGEVTEDGVRLADGRFLPARTVVWAAGVRADPLAATLGVELGRGGRIVVGDDLSVPGHPEVFAIGDIGINPAAPLPQVAQPAIQGGRYVAALIARRGRGDLTAPAAFRYHDKGSMATIGRHDAVAEFPNGWRLTGPIGWLAWLGLHILYLMGFRNRANVLVNWAWNYLTFDRGARLLMAREERRADAELL